MLTRVKGPTHFYYYAFAYPRLINCRTLLAIIQNRPPRYLSLSFEAIATIC